VKGKTFAAVTAEVPLTKRFPGREGETTTRQARNVIRGPTKTTSGDAKQLINKEESATASEEYRFQEMPTQTWNKIQKRLQDLITAKNKMIPTKNRFKILANCDEVSPDPGQRPVVGMLSTHERRPQRQPDRRKTTKKASIPRERKEAHQNGNFFTVRMRVNGQLLPTVIDTASSENLLHISNISSDQLVPVITELTAANELKVDILGEAVVPVGIGWKTENCKFLIHNYKSDALNCLLGTRWFDTYGADIDYKKRTFSYDYKGERITIRRYGSPKYDLYTVLPPIAESNVFLTALREFPDNFAQDNYSSHRSVFTKNETWFEPGQQKLVDVTMFPHELVEPAIFVPRQIADDSHIVALDTYLENGHNQILMINKSDKAQILDKHSKVGFVFPDEVQVGVIPDREWVKALEQEAWNETPITGYPFPTPRKLPKIEDFSMGKTLTDQQKFELYKLLLANLDVFHFPGDKLSSCKVAEATIQLKDPSQIIWQPPHNMTLEQQDIALEVVKDLEKRDIVEKCEIPSNFSIPFLLVRKRSEHGNSSESKDINNTWRFVLDCKKLNKAMKKVVYGPPSVNNVLQCLRNSKFLTSLDMKDSFSQILLQESSKDLTAFKIRNTQWRYRRLPQGLCTAAQLLQYTLEKTLQPMLTKNAISYIDDVILWSPSNPDNPDLEFQEHLQVLSQAFALYRRAGLTLRIDKCKFAFLELAFLGYHISGSHLRPDKSRFKSLEVLLNCKNRKELKSALCYLAYHRTFIPDFARESQVIRDKVNEDSSMPFQMTEAVKNCMRKLYERLLSEATLHYFDPNCTENLIAVDSSRLGVGAGLLQKCPRSGKFKVVRLMSRAFPVRKGPPLSAYKAELLGLKMMLENFSSEISTLSQVTILTDCKALVTLPTLKVLSSQQAVVVSMLEGFGDKIKLKHVKGKINTLADYLSRHMEICDIERDQGRTGDPWMHPRDRQTPEEEDVGFRGTIYAKDPDPNEPFTDSIMPDGSIEKLAETPRPPSQTTCVMSRMIDPILGNSRLRELCREKNEEKLKALGKNPNNEEAREDKYPSYQDLKWPKFPTHLSTQKKCKQSAFADSASTSVNVITRAQAQKAKLSSGESGALADITYLPLNADPETRPRSITKNPEIKWADIMPNTFELPSAEERLHILKEAQLRDPEMQKVINKIQKGEIVDGYELRQGVLVIRKFGRWLISLPESLKLVALRFFHDSFYGHHFGSYKMYLKLKLVCYWKNMFADCKSYSQSCEVCQTRNPKLLKLGLMGTLEANYPFEICSLDVAEMPTSSSGYSHCLVFVENFSKFIYCHPIKRVTTENCIRAFLKIIQNGVIPRLLILDRASAFQSKDFKSFAKRLGMELNFVAPLNHMISLSEMAIKRLNWSLRAFANPSFTNWDQMLSLAVTVLNQSISKTKFSPAELLFGVPDTHMPGDFMDLLADPKSLTDYARERIKKRIEYVKRRLHLRISQANTYNRNRKPVEFVKGQHVYAFLQAQKKFRLPGKFQVKWRFAEIVKKLTPLTYLVRLWYKNKIRVKKFHINLLKPAYKRPAKFQSNNIEEKPYKASLRDIGPTSELVNLPTPLPEGQRPEVMLF